MLVVPRRGWPAAFRPRRRRGDDSGFLLMEVIVAIVVLALVAGGILAGVVLSTNMTRNDRNRVAAAHLADRELEISRFQFLQDSATLVSQPYAVNPDPLPGQTAGNPSVLNGTSYTVVRTIQALPQGNSGQSACSGGGNVTYLEYLVSVDVTWLRGSTRPVQASTILTPDKTVVSSTDAYLGVAVSDSTGAAVVGQNVTVTGPGPAASGSTGDDGCYVATLQATSGPWTAALTGSGYVDFYGNPAPTRSLTIAAGTFSSVPMTWDRAATINPSYAGPGGYATPSSVIGLSAYNSGVTNPPNSIRPFSTANSATNLWPFSDGYSVWAGACTDADPATPAVGGTRPANIATAPGATVSANLPLGGVDVRVRKGGADVSGVQLKAVHAADASPNGCLSGQTLTFSGFTDSSGQTKIALPYGSWQIQVVGKTPSSSWPTLVVTAASTTTPISAGIVSIN
jgi:type II secretory pathway pseudopilin PulG